MTASVDRNQTLANTRPTLCKYKIVFLGDVMTGKTTFISRFLYTNDKWGNSYQPTIGIDFLSTSLHIGNRSMRLQIWDTAGQERFRSLIPSYIRDCSVAFVLFDVSSRKSFENLEAWIARVRQDAKDSVIIAIIGNKTDLEKRQVSPEEARKYAQESGCLYDECSARTGENVRHVFIRACGNIPVPSTKTMDQNIVGNTLETIKLNDPFPPSTVSSCSSCT